MIEWLRNVLRAPAPASAWGDPERVATVRDVLAELAPLVELDGGRIELLGVDDDGWVEVRLEGACASCSQRSTTLDQALAPALTARAPWFAGVRSR